MNKENEQKLHELIGSNPNEQYSIEGDNITFIREQNITVQSGGNFYNGSQPKHPKSSSPEKEDNTLILKLMPIFMDNEDYVASFLKDIKGCTDMQITETVKRYRTKKKLDAQKCHHNLWQILFDSKIYTSSERNWNARISY